MATAPAQQSDYTCPKCQKQFSTPKILSCAHHLCRQCLVTSLNLNSEPKCPECEDKIVLKKTSIFTGPGNNRHDKIVDALPTDLALEARVECADILSNDSKCECCRETAATAICLNCGDKLCADCTTKHKNMSVSRHHIVEEMSRMTAEDLASKRQIHCSEHSNESVWFCNTCSASICCHCATSTHRNRTCDLVDFEERMGMVHVVLAGLTATLQERDCKLKLDIGELDGYLSDLERERQATRERIRLECDQLKESIDACFQRLIKQIELHFSEKKKRAEEEKAAISKRQKRVRSHQRLVDSVDNKMPRVCGASDFHFKLLTAVQNLGLDVTLPADLKPVTLAFNEKEFKRIKYKLSQLDMPTVWRFHRKHGTYIKLSHDQRVAERIEGDESSLVFSRDALMRNTLYEVRLDAVNSMMWTFPFGVTDGDPEKLTLPEPPYPLESMDAVVDVVLIGSLDVIVYGLKTTPDFGERCFSVGSRVGVLVDSEDKLHLYIDGHDRGVAASDIRRPCHAFFYVRGGYKKISTLPLRTIASVADDTMHNVSLDDAESATDSDTDSNTHSVIE